MSSRLPEDGEKIRIVSLKEILEKGFCGKRTGHLLCIGCLDMDHPIFDDDALYEAREEHGDCPREPYYCCCDDNYFSPHFEHYGVTKEDIENRPMLFAITTRNNVCFDWLSCPLSRKG